MSFKKGSTVVIKHTNSIMGVLLKGSPPTLTAPPAAPSILQHPSDLIVAASQTATFTCVSSGEPPPTVAWTLDGVPLDPASGQVSVQTSGPTSVLLVADAQGEDEGSYRCVASNSEGEATSNAADLQLACKQTILNFYHNFSSSLPPHVSMQKLATHSLFVTGYFFDK